MLNNNEMLYNWKENIKIAAEELCWENEKEKLIQVFKTAGLV